MSDLSVGISSCEMEGVLYDAMVSESGHQGWKSVKMIMRSKLDKEIAVVPYMTITLCVGSHRLGSAGVAFYFQDFYTSTSGAVC